MNTQKPCPDFIKTTFPENWPSIQKPSFTNNRSTCGIFKKKNKYKNNIHND